MYNCSATLVDRLDAFPEAMFLLLSGSGVGYSIQFEHVEKLPAFGFIDQKRIRHHIVSDSIEGWADALKALVWSYVTGEYLEISYHLVRPAGSPLKTSGGVAPGHVPLKTALQRVRQVLDAAQGRRLRPIECHRIMCHAADAVLSGGVRRSAMIAIFSLEDSEMMNAKTGDWFSREPWFANANNSVSLVRGESKKKHFMRIFEMTKQFGEPGFLFTSDHDYVTNPCVPAGTRLLTRRGYRCIEDLVGVETEAWNGEEWSLVTPAVTGRGKHIVRVHLSDGTSLNCTDDHEWCLFTGRRKTPEVRVKASMLRPGDQLSKYDMPVIEAGASLPHAYTHGFWCGDRETEDAGRKVVSLYGVKKGLLSFLEHERTTQPTVHDLLRVVLTKDMPDKFVVPTGASMRSRLEWLAGLLDSDGNVVRQESSRAAQVSSVNPEFLKEVRLMLTTLGVQAKVHFKREGGARMLPDGRGGLREYDVQDEHRLLICAEDVWRLMQLGMQTHRLDLCGNRPELDRRHFVTVEWVEDYGTADLVYCFTEPKNHTGTFEGIVTGQCAEIGLNPRMVVDDSIQRRMATKGVSLKRGQTLTGWALCNLCEINAAKFASPSDFFEAAEAATLIGTLQAAYTDMPYLGWVSEEIAKRDSLLGVGMTGMLRLPSDCLRRRTPARGSHQNQGVEHHLCLAHRHPPGRPHDVRETERNDEPRARVRRLRPPSSPRAALHPTRDGRRARAGIPSVPREEPAHVREKTRRQVGHRVPRRGSGGGYRQEGPLGD